MFNGSKIVVLMQVMKLITGRVKEKQARPFTPRAIWGFHKWGVPQKWMVYKGKSH